MISSDFQHSIASRLHELSSGGYEKVEHVINSAQGRVLTLENGKEVLNFCANNYLGLAGHPTLIDAACEGMKKWGYGMASVRFICGTQEIHKELEDALSHFLGMEDTILYSSCFDANAGLFETLLGAEDSIISDALNHASIIDGVRLCKAKRYRYRNNDMEDLEAKLIAARNAGVGSMMIATDGVFSMDGTVANLPIICDLAEKYGALVMVDDSHATGFVGPQGRGTPEHHAVAGRVDILTGTLGKALGGGSGGYVSASQSIVNLLRQRSRPYLFSNSLLPSVVCAALRAIELLKESPALRVQLADNVRFFRNAMEETGLRIIGEDHPIVPVMLGEATVAKEMAKVLLAEGIYAVAFSYPVVPKGQARIRVQISANHQRQDLEIAVEAFRKAGCLLGII